METINMEKNKMKQEIIENLTEEQEAKLESYYEKWLSIGLQSRSTTNADRKAVELALKELYKQEDLKEPKVIWARSPFEAVSICKELGDKGSEFQWSASYGAHDANWLGFYDFMMNELGLVEECNDLIPHMTIAKHCGWFWCYENAVICSELPILTSVNAEGNLHNFNGSALEWADGEALYYFNNVQVTKELAEKPASEITKEDILGEENADIRREMIKKIGIEKTFEILDAKIVDEMECPVGGKYSLALIDYQNDGVMRTYLTMINPSLGDKHIEGVEASDNKVTTALCFRNDLTEWIAPISLS